MAREIRPATEDNRICLQNAIKAMRDARYWLRAANSPRTLARLEATIRSAGGAERHMSHRIRRTNEA